MYSASETLSSVPLCASPYRLNRAWFATHREEIGRIFPGQWVGIANEKIFAHPSDVTIVYAAIERTGVAAYTAYILFVPR